MERNGAPLVPNEWKMLMNVHHFLKTKYIFTKRQVPNARLILAEAAGVGSKTAQEAIRRYNEIQNGEIKEYKIKKLGRPKKREIRDAETKEMDETIPFKIDKKLTVIKEKKDKFKRMEGNNNKPNSNEVINILCTPVKASSSEAVPIEPNTINCIPVEIKTNEIVPIQVNNIEFTPVEIKSFDAVPIKANTIDCRISEMKNNEVVLEEMKDNEVFSAKTLEFFMHACNNLQRN